MDPCWKDLPRELVGTIRCAADASTWRAMDLASGHARREFAPLALPALRRVDALLQLMRKQRWLCTDTRQRDVTTVCVSLHDDNIHIRAQHIDRVWLVFGTNRRKTWVRMEGMTNDALMALLRPLVRRGLEIGRPCTAGVYPTLRHCVVGYSGPELDLDSNFYSIRDIPSGGFTERLAMLLDMISKRPARLYAVIYRSAPWDGPCFTTVLSYFGVLRTGDFYGDIPETLDYVRRQPEAFTAIHLDCLDSLTQETVASFFPPSYNLQSHFRQLL